LAGGLYAMHHNFVSPSSLNWLQSTVLLVMVLFGGKRTLIGPLIGAVIYTVLQAWASSRTDVWALFVGLLLIALVLSGRNGLLGFWRVGERRA
jgi:branched-chain amino acid transport system permease protein